MKTVRDILKKPANEISESMHLDLNSKRIKFIDHLYAIIYSALHKYDLTDTSIDNGISKSWLSKLNNSKSYIPFIELFYKLLKPYIKAHDYRVYSRYMRVLAIDSTFIKTLMNGSGSYKGESDGMKIHVPAIVFPFTVPLNAYISSANVNDSSLFDNIINNIDSKILYSSILVFDLGYYNLDRFKLLADKNILFVSRIKRNAVYTESGTVNGHEMVEMNNGLYLRIVRVNVDGIEYKYITDIMNLPDKYIYYAYNLRWNIEELFKRMKSQLKIDHLLSKSLNGMIIQVFSYMTAYIVVNMIMESMGIMVSFPEIIRGIRHGNIRYFNNIYNINLSKI
jgi:hypothetical protein